MWPELEMQLRGRSSAVHTCRHRSSHAWPCSLSAQDMHASCVHGKAILHSTLSNSISASISWICFILSLTFCPQPEADRPLEAAWVHHVALLQYLQSSLLHQSSGCCPSLLHQRSPVAGTQLARDLAGSAGDARLACFQQVQYPVSELLVQIRGIRGALCCLLVLLGAGRGPATSFAFGHLICSQAGVLFTRAAGHGSEL